MRNLAILADTRLEATIEMPSFRGRLRGEPPAQVFGASGLWIRSASDALLLGVRLLEPLPQLARELVEAALAAGLQVDVVELALLRHARVAEGAGEVRHAPGLVQRAERVPGDHQVAHVAEVAEQLVVVRLAVGQALLLVVPMAEERLLALGADLRLG